MADTIAAAKRRPSGVLGFVVRAIKNSRERVFDLAQRKGGVVRRPFLGGSRPELIAVSPQPGVAVAIGTAALPLERLKVGARPPRDDLPRERLRGFARSRFALANLDSMQRQGTERGSRQAPASPSPASSSDGGTAPSPLSDLTRAAAASLPVVSDRSLRSSPAAGVTRRLLTAPPKCVDRATSPPA